jgi:hypothetical protein
MFEAAQEPKQSNAGRMWVVTVVVVAMAGLGTWLYTTSKSPSRARATVVSAAATPVGKADPVHDLKVLNARMEKDPTGTIAMWIVQMDNKSKAYTYSTIEYETTYVGANNAALAVNKGIINVSLAPGDQQTAQVRDILYPIGTSWYKFRITGAKSRIE